MTGTPSTLMTPSGRQLAYYRLKGKTPGVMFLGGFRSDMTGSKALAVEGWCRAQGIACLRFDYSGHGQSEGKFEDGTIGQWKDDALAALGLLTEGPQILVGSSMGGWLMLLVARERPERVAGLVGIASAPDFTERLVWQGFTKKQQQEMQKKSRVLIPDCYGTEPYAITRQLIEEGRDHLLLQKPIPIHCPVRLLHGMQDEDVPWEFAMSLNEKLESKDVRLTLVPDGKHRMSEPKQLALLEKTLAKLWQQVAG